MTKEIDAEMMTEAIEGIVVIEAIEVVEVTEVIEWTNTVVVARVVLIIKIEEMTINILIEKKKEIETDLVTMMLIKTEAVDIGDHALEIEEVDLGQTKEEMIEVSKITTDTHLIKELADSMWMKEMTKRSK